jgi:dihydropteroate synthase
MNDFSSTNPFFSRSLSMNCHGRLIDLQIPKVMGIINITNDSFYEGSRYTEPEQIMDAARTMIGQGADIIDVGAFSSRPGAQMISEDEELQKLMPALQMIRNEFPEQLISVDTVRSSVAKAVVEEWKVDIINDISGGDMDPRMIKVISRLHVPYILMHMKGSPETMQQNPEYANVVDEVLQYFGQKVHHLRKEGVNDIIVDPGFGFGKTLDHNYTLLHHLDAFRVLELPIMVGLSRKSMIYRKLDTGPEESLNGTTAVNMAALLKGASILRVHDVKAAVETVQIFIEIVKTRK